MLLIALFAAFGIFCTLMTVWMWWWSRERFANFYDHFENLSSFGPEYTRGMLRAMPVMVAGLDMFLVLAGLQAFEEMRIAEGHAESRTIFWVSGGVLAAAMFTFLVLMAASWFGRPRWMLIPYLRDEKSAWEKRREAKAARRD